MHERMSDEAFFALPDANDICGGFGMAPLKEEGAPIYRDADGYRWVLSKTPDGRDAKAPLI